jgi:hypothetical protein
MTHDDASFLYRIYKQQKPMAYILQDASSFCHSRMIHATSNQRLRMDVLFMLGRQFPQLTKEGWYAMISLSYAYFCQNL